MNDYHLLLGRNNTNYLERLKSGIKNSYQILDIDYSDKHCVQDGFYGLTQTIKTPSAWDKAFYEIENSSLVNLYENFWFIEDDVHTNDINTLITLFSEYNSINCDLISLDITTYDDCNSWYHWRNVPSYMKLYRSYNPICRLSNALIKKVLDFRKINKKLVFHEVLFAFLAKKSGLKTLDMRKDKCYDILFGTFHYRPVIKINTIQDNKIYHPVKNTICR